MTEDLLLQARAGDADAFAALVAPYRGELHLHCYRMLGSVADADDALQETLLAVWRGLPRFEERASLRTWLYRVATRKCLNAVRARRRQAAVGAVPSVVPVPPATRVNELTWLEPYPDLLLDHLPDPRPDPAARAETNEAVSLAYVAALQLLPPRQRAVLVLREVLEFTARETADMLGMTEQAATSALKRARATLSGGKSRVPVSHEAAAATSTQDRALLRRFVAAFEARDVAGIVALLAEDVRLRMPPLPLEYEGRCVVREFLAGVAFRHGRRYRLVGTAANRQPAFGMYLRDEASGRWNSYGVLVVGVCESRISGITRFANAPAEAFGLAPVLSD